MVGSVMKACYIRCGQQCTIFLVYRLNKLPTLHVIVVFSAAEQQANLWICILTLTDKAPRSLSMSSSCYKSGATKWSRHLNLNAVKTLALMWNYSSLTKYQQLIVDWLCYHFFVLCFEKFNVYYNVYSKNLRILSLIQNAFSTKISPIGKTISMFMSLNAYPESYKSTPQIAGR